jgi:hypothetical protein
VLSSILNYSLHTAITITHSVSAVHYTHTHTPVLWYQLPMEDVLLPGIPNCPRATATATHSALSIFNCLLLSPTVLSGALPITVWLLVKVKVTLRLMVGYSVGMSWCQAPSGSHDQMFVTVWWLLLWREVGSVDCQSECIFKSFVNTFVFTFQMFNIQFRVHTLCTGGLEYLHWCPASRKGRRKGNPAPGGTTGPRCSWEAQTQGPNPPGWGSLKWYDHVGQSGCCFKYISHWFFHYTNQIHFKQVSSLQSAAN